MSMYYRNLAADALLENDTRNAFWLTRKALELAPEDAENINLMAIIYRRLAMPELSEQYYQYGMAVAQNNTNMLSNYAILLESQNRTRDAEKIRQRLLDFPDNNPYAWIKLGHEAYQEENHSRAINYYKKAMALAPYLDEIYFGLAKSLYRRGEYAKAAQAMRVAAEKSWAGVGDDSFLASAMLLAGLAESSGFAFSSDDSGLSVSVLSPLDGCFSKAGFESELVEFSESGF